MEATVSVEI